MWRHDPADDSGLAPRRAAAALRFARRLGVLLVKTHPLSWTASFASRLAASVSVDGQYADGGSFAHEIQYFATEQKEAQFNRPQTRTARRAVAQARS